MLGLLFDLNNEDMALIGDDGKIRGVVGNLVFRRVNNKGVLQSHPGPLKPKGGTVQENKRFGWASELTAVLYPLIRNFGLNMCYSYVFGRLLNYFKRVLYTDFGGKEMGEYLYLDEDNSLAKIFKELPTAEKIGNIITLKIPSIQLLSRDRKYANARLMEYRMQLWLLNYDTYSPNCIYTNITKRFDMNKKVEAEEFIIDLSELEDDVLLGEKLSELKVSLDEGLLVMCFGVRFFEYNNDYVGLNTKKFNPASVLGTWHLGGKWSDVK